MNTHPEHEALKVSDGWLDKDFFPRVLEASKHKARLRGRANLKKLGFNVTDLGKAGIGRPHPTIPGTYVEGTGPPEWRKIADDKLKGLTITSEECDRLPAWPSAWDHLRVPTNLDGSYAYDWVAESEKILTAFQARLPQEASSASVPSVQVMSAVQQRSEVVETDENARDKTVPEIIDISSEVSSEYNSDDEEMQTM